MIGLDVDPLLQRIKRLREVHPGGAQQEYDCPICRDTEMIFYTEDGVEYAKPCECASRKQAVRLMMASGISEEDAEKGFKDFKTFNDPELIKIRDMSIDYYKNFLRNTGKRGNTILFCGASGRGKTTLGFCIANNLINNNVGVRYTPYRQEITALKQEVTDTENYSRHMNQLKTCKVLFLDDFFKGKITDSDINIMYELINHRYLARLPIILTTERSINDLMAIDEATASRLVEMAGAYVIPFSKTIQNYRLRGNL